jgi:hypothetical protein
MEHAGYYRASCGIASSAAIVQSSSCTMNEIGNGQEWLSKGLYDNIYLKGAVLPSKVWKASRISQE